MSRVIGITSSLVTGPAVPPVTVEYAKKHIKAISSAEDILVATWIEAARSYFEEQTGRQIITATWEAWLDGCPDCRGRIELPKPPLQDVISVQYVDASGTLVSFDDGASPVTLSYAVKAPRGEYAGRGWIEPIYGVQWPTSRAESGAVRIQYRAGYGDSEEDVPALITGILAFLIGNHDQFRAAVHQEEQGAIAEVPYGVRMMLDGFKYSALPTVQMRTSVPWV